VSETLEIPAARIPLGPPKQTPTKPPEVVHYYSVEHQRPRLGQRLPFLCGDVGVLDYRGIGQHRPVPAVGRMAACQPLVDVCVDCDELYAEEVLPRATPVVHATPVAVAA
jgi:hypothetical protein